MKKTLALILTFIMVLALVPTVAFAASPKDADINGYLTVEYKVPSSDLEQKRDVNVEVYVNYGKVAEETIKGVAAGFNNFKLKTIKSGLYYGVAANNHDTVNCSYDNNTLGFNLFNQKPATLRLYLFTFNNGHNVDFTRYVNLATGNWDKACSTLRISYTLDGQVYSYDYTKWDQLHTTYVPNATDIYVTPTIKSGYKFEVWRSADAFGDGANRLYSIKNGQLVEEQPTYTLPGIGTLPNKVKAGSYALTENMAFYIGSGYNRIQIALYMRKDNEQEKVTHTLTYDLNGGTGTFDVQSYGPTTDASHDFTIHGDKPTRDGYQFLGWADNESATVPTYQPKGKITVNGIKTIYAVWKMNAPEAPDHDKISELIGTGKIKVQCMTDSTAHPVADYDLKANSYNKSTVTLNESGVFTCTVTVMPDEYVKEYNNTYNGHTLDPDTQADGKPVTFVWDTKVEGENKWVLADQSTVLPVVFTVMHATTVPGSVSAVTKTRLKEVPEGVSLPENVTINKEETVIFTDNNPSATLLYAFTVTGTPSAEVEIKDDGATFIDNDKSEITVTLPAAGGNETKTSTTVHGYRTFSVDDIKDGKLVNNATANVTNGDPNNDKTDTEDVPALDNRTLDNTLTVKKLVSGNAADTTEEFTFKATFTFPVPANSPNLDDVTSGVTSGEKVEITFELAHGHAKTFSYKSDEGLKTKIDNWMKESGSLSGDGDAVFATLSYKVEEIDTKGYTRATDGAAEGTAEGRKTVIFTNTKNKPNDDHGGHYHTTTTPVPVIVIPPKTGDMTVWQSILHFLGIR